MPLILDNAYGIPFPGIVFRDVEPFWDENVILCMSLSKIGLPAVRTGIVIAREEIVDAMTSLNAVVSLAVSSVGPVLMRELVHTGADHPDQPRYRSSFLSTALRAGAGLAARRFGRLRLSCTPPGRCLLSLVMGTWFTGHERRTVPAAESARCLRPAGPLFFPWVDGRMATPRSMHKDQLFPEQRRGSSRASRSLVMRSGKLYRSFVI